MKNRWGELVYSSKDISQSWNGQFNNKAMPIGVYVYVINIAFAEAEKETELFSGDVTLIR